MTSFLANLGPYHLHAYSTTAALGGYIASGFYKKYVIAGNPIALTLIEETLSSISLMMLEGVITPYLSRFECLDGLSIIYSPGKNFVRGLSKIENTGDLLDLVQTPFAGRMFEAMLQFHQIATELKEALQDYHTQQRSSSSPSSASVRQLSRSRIKRSVELNKSGTMSKYCKKACASLVAQLNKHRMLFTVCGEALHHTMAFVLFENLLGNGVDVSGFELGQQDQYLEQGDFFPIEKPSWDADKIGTGAAFLTGLGLLFMADAGGKYLARKWWTSDTACCGARPKDFNSNPTTHANIRLSQEELQYVLMKIFMSIHLLTSPYVCDDIIRHIESLKDDPSQADVKSARSSYAAYRSFHKYIRLLLNHFETQGIDLRDLGFDIHTQQSTPMLTVSTSQGDTKSGDLLSPHSNHGLLFFDETSHSSIQKKTRTKNSRGKRWYQPICRKRGCREGRNNKGHSKQAFAPKDGLSPSVKSEDVEKVEIIKDTKSKPSLQEIATQTVTMQ